MELITIDSTEVLIAKINTAHAEAQAYAGKAIERALEAGDLLLLAKGQVVHGQWQSWLKEHCPAISVRTAQDYMRVAKELPVEKRSAAHLTVREALRLVSGGGGGDEPVQETQNPWWCGKPPEVNAAWCADSDSFRSACVWMDAEGKSIHEIAECLGFEDKYVAAFIDPKIPDLYRDFSDNEEISIWNNVIEKTNSHIAYVKNSSYMDAARLAKYCCNEDMEKKLLCIADIYKRRYEGFNKEKDILIDYLALRLFKATIYLHELHDAVWLEIGYSLNLLFDVYESQETQRQRKSFA